MCNLAFKPDGDAPLAGRTLVVDPGLTPDQLAALELLAHAVAERNKLGAGVASGSERIIRTIEAQVSAAIVGLAQADFSGAQMNILAAAAELLVLYDQAAAAERLHALAHGICPDLWPEAPVAPASADARQGGGPS